MQLTFCQSRFSHAIYAHTTYLGTYISSCIAWFNPKTLISTLCRSAVRHLQWKHPVAYESLKPDTVRKWFAKHPKSGETSTVKLTKSSMNLLGSCAPFSRSKNARPLWLNAYPAAKAALVSTLQGMRSNGLALNLPLSRQTLICFRTR